jgi:hypothetical protein
VPTAAWNYVALPAAWTQLLPSGGMAEPVLLDFSQPPHNFSPREPQTTQTFHVPDAFGDVHTEDTSNSGSAHSHETQPITDSTEGPSQYVVWPTSDYDARECHRGIGNVLSGLAQQRLGATPPTLPEGKCPKAREHPLHAYTQPHALTMEYLVYCLTDDHYVT